MYGETHSGKALISKLGEFKGAKGQSCYERKAHIWFLCKVQKLSSVHCLMFETIHMTVGGL